MRGEGGGQETEFRGQNPEDERGVRLTSPDRLWRTGGRSGFFGIGGLEVLEEAGEGGACLQMYQC
jgi:hypothetical protein